MLPQTLDPVEVRVLGSLIEKALSTPDHYPLSLNALTSACNQSSNRDPVMMLDEAAVLAAVTVLRRRSLVRSIQSSGSRVSKYEHLLTQACDLSRVELAVLCVLALRGPQTLAEVRTRAARLTPGEDADSVEAALEALVSRTPSPGVARLERRPGQKEVRYAHLLSGDAFPDEENGVAPTPVSSTDRMAALEEVTRNLRHEVDALRSQFAEFRKQFE